MRRNQDFKSTPYRERLNRNFVSSWLHGARFRWVNQMIAGRRVEPYSIAELGCFDGSLLDHLTPAPIHYSGFDAGWEGGLDRAIARFSGRNDRVFSLARDPLDLEHIPSKSHTFGVCLETLEHVPPDLVDGYLCELARICREAVLITVPNEIGAIFLAKWSLKSIKRSHTQNYSLSDVWNLTRGRSERVVRDDHKGFDYRELLRTVEKEFNVFKAESIPLPFTPVRLGFSIGFVAEPKR